MSSFKDLTGKRFGRLVALCPVEKDKSGRYKWRCKCDCGNETAVVGAYLARGETSSCGCLRIEAVVAHNKSHEKRESTAKYNSKYKFKHGQTGSRLYRVWSGMKRRCYSPTLKDYQWYGERGIKVCDEWQDYSAFEKWALANGYDETAKRGECTLDRINSDGNYEPSNCRWVTVAEQNRNKRPGGKKREAAS